MLAQLAVVQPKVLGGGWLACTEASAALPFLCECPCTGSLAAVHCSGCRTLHPLTPSLLPHPLPCRQAFSSWIHICAVRLFVESILRYGLPPQVHFAGGSREGIVVWLLRAA